MTKAPESATSVRSAANVSTVPLMEVRNLSKHFGGLRAVSSASFTIKQGEIVGVIGPNGAGKTTLFALLSGFLSPTNGEIRFEGISIVGLGPNRLCHLGIARTFQTVRPFLDMTVFENVKAGGVFGKPGKRSSQQIHRSERNIGEHLARCFREPLSAISKSSSAYAAGGSQSLGHESQASVVG